MTLSQTEFAFVSTLVRKEASIVLAPGTRIDFRKQRFNRRPGFVTQPILSGHDLVFPARRSGWIRSEKPSDSYCLIGFGA